MRRTSSLVIAVLCVTSSCARPYAPPGGERDVLPPRVISSEPAALAVVPAGNAPVVFRFDEKISERGFSEALVTVSPLDGALRVDRKKTEVRVSIDGGWRAGRVYRIVLLPGVRDLFGNARTDAAEVVFSTGPPVNQTAIAGIVLDRISERAAQNPLIMAVRRADSASYVAVGDSGGFFALRHLPLGVYEVRAISDQNRNRRQDSSEPVARDTVVILGSEMDTLTLVFNTLSPDSTPARVQNATAVDSMSVRVTFDDYLVAEDAFAGASAEVYALPDSALYATSESIQLEQARQRGAAARDTTQRAGAAARDTAQRAAAVARDTVPARVMPAREAIVVLNRTLRPGSYRIVVRNVTNISGVAGSSSARFEVRAPAAPPAARDTGQIAPRRPR